MQHQILLLGSKKETNLTSAKNEINTGMSWCFVIGWRLRSSARRVSCSCQVGSAWKLSLLGLRAAPIKYDTLIDDPTDWYR